MSFKAPEHRHSSIQLHQGQFFGGPNGSHLCPSPGQADIPAGPAASSSPSTAKPLPRPKAQQRSQKSQPPRSLPRLFFFFLPIHHLSHPPHHADSCPGACFPKQKPCCVPRGVHPFGQGGSCTPCPAPRVLQHSHVQGPDELNGPRGEKTGKVTKRKEIRDYKRQQTTTTTKIYSFLLKLFL